jgi:hypothetical protein
VYKLVYGPIPDDPPYSPRLFPSATDLLNWFNDEFQDAEEPQTSVDEVIWLLSEYGYTTTIEGAMITNNHVVEMRRQREMLLERISEIRMLLIKTSNKVQDDALNIWLKPLDLAAARMEATIKQMEEEAENEP